MNAKINPVSEQRPAGAPVQVRSLSALDKITLGSQNRQMLNHAHNSCGGPAFWRYRKLAEGHDLLALSEITSRFKVTLLDLRETLRAIVQMQVPVPCEPDKNGNLRIDQSAILAMRYPEEAIRIPLPGFSFVEILQPRGIWHANVSAEAVQMLCLGAQLPAGIQLKEIVLMSYGALSMQTVMIDEMDAAGVLNPEAARWWQHNINLVPLSRTPFFDHHVDTSQ
jgi:hypothetical protein